MMKGFLKYIPVYQRNPVKAESCPLWGHYLGDLVIINIYSISTSKWEAMGLILGQVIYMIFKF